MPGYCTLSGSITTDGTLGPITTANLVSATVTISEPGYGKSTTTLKPSSGGLSTALSGLYATTTTLTLPFAGQFEFDGRVLGAGQSFLVYNNPYTSYPPYGDEFAYWGAISAITPTGLQVNTNGWQDWWTDGTGTPPWNNIGPAPSFATGSSWLIAKAAPEPSAVVALSGLGAIGLIAAWRRRKRTAA
jgi:hypothetical protein